MAKVKEYVGWRKLIFADRAILRSDIAFMSSEQQRNLENLEVLLVEDKGKTLIVENK